MSTPKISAVLAARKNSKYLAKFLFGFFENTSILGDIELLVMLNAHDTWNIELIEHFSRAPYNVQFYYEDKGLGRAGLHEYFNELVQDARGDWIIYFCEDHFISKKGWDDLVRHMIQGNLMVNVNDQRFLKHQHGRLDPKQIWCLVPKFDNCGAMNHIVSRGYIEALGGVLGRHGWIDSYINDVFEYYPERVLRFDEELFHDFTHDQPNPMSEGHMQSVSSAKAKRTLPTHGSKRYGKLVREDVIRLQEAIMEDRV